MNRLLNMVTLVASIVLEVDSTSILWDDEVSVLPMCHYHWLNLDLRLIQLIGAAREVRFFFFFVFLMG